MCIEENKDIVRRSYEQGVNVHNMDVIDELFDAQFIGHIAGRAEPIRGLEAFKKQQIMPRLAAFPDLHVTVVDLIAEGDMVAAREIIQGAHQNEFMGIPPTGKQITIAEPTFTVLRLARLSKNGSSQTLYRAKTPRRPVNWSFNLDGDHGMITDRAVSTAIFDLWHGVQLAQVVRPRRRYQGHRDPHPAPRSLSAAPSDQQTSTPMARPSDPGRPDPPTSSPATRPPHRYSQHAAGLAPPLGRQEVDLSKPIRPPAPQ